MTTKALEACQLLIDNAVNRIQRGALDLSSCACSVLAPRLESFLCWDRAWMETSWPSAALRRAPIVACSRVMWVNGSQ